MKKFDVFVQGNFYKEVSAKNTGDVLAMISKDIQNNLVPGLDSAKNHEIKIVRKN
jgi:hypothetical protein